MDCVCIDACDDDNGFEFQRERIVTARKEHKCFECGITISVGDKYEDMFMVNSDGPYKSKTCVDCKSARDAFFCTWTYGNVWHDLKEHLRYHEEGDCLSKALLKCTQIARTKISDIIEEGLT